MTTQLAVTGLALINGFLILRFLPLREYGVYIVASALASMFALLSDFGTSQAVVSLGAPVRERTKEVGRIAAAAFRLRRRLFGYLFPVFCAASAYCLWLSGSTPAEIGLLTMLVLGTTWVQQSIAVRTSVANLHHDSRALAWSNGVAGLLRLALITTACQAFPLASVALGVNLAGLVLTQLMLARLAPMDAALDSPEHGTRIKDFIRPLVPGVLYYAVQSHISTYLLTLQGALHLVAEVGALTRLGQLLALLSLLNGFLFQPVFARIADRRTFRKRLLQCLVGLAGIFALLSWSAVVIPGPWLLILGPQYEGLQAELPIALLGAECAVLGAFLYTVVVSRADTTGQYHQIVLGIGLQLAFLVFNGVATTRDALILNFLPALGYVVLQAALLIRAHRSIPQ